MSRPAAFLDRDGTVIADPGYLDAPEDLHLLPGAARAIARLNEAGFAVVMVTNQSGIGRGYYSEEDFQRVQAELDARLADAGARIDAVYFCPHDPTVHACGCRKPGTELFERAIEEHDLDPAASWFIGDRMRDVAPAAHWGGRPILVDPSAGAGAGGPAPDDVPRAPSLSRAVDRVLGPAAPLRVVVLVSGSGSNLQALIDRFTDDPDVEISGVVASRPGIRALQRAAAAHIPTAVLQAHRAEESSTSAAARAAAAAAHAETAAECGGADLAAGAAAPDEVGELATLLRGFGADLVVLAGYLRLVPEEVVREWRGRMLNVHPALLPAFGGEGMYGRRVHEAVLEAGVSETGVTIHLVDEEYDRGPIVARRRVPVRPGDDAEGLAARVLEQEHELLPEVVAAVAGGACRLSAEGPRWVRPPPETEVPGRDFE